MTEEKTPVHDVHEEEIQKLMDFGRSHGKTLLIAVCVAAVTVASVRIYRHNRSAERAEASRLLAESRSPGDLQDLLEQHASTPAAPLALLKLAKSHFDLGDHQSALRQYEEFTTTYADHRLADGAVLGRLHCLEAIGRLDEAAAGFATFVKDKPESFLMAQALLGQGRCLEQLGRTEEARMLYEDFVAAHPDSPWKENAEESLELIASGARLPPPGPGPTAPLPVVEPVDLPQPVVSNTVSAGVPDVPPEKAAEAAPPAGTEPEEVAD